MLKPPEETITLKKNIKKFKPMNSWEALVAFIPANIVTDFYD